MNWQELWKTLIEQLYFDFITFFRPNWEERIDFTRPPTFLNLPLDVAKTTPHAPQQNLVIGIREKTGDIILLLTVLEQLGYDNRSFGKQLFKDFTKTLAEFENKMPVTVQAIFLANSLPKDAKQYEYSYDQIQMQMQFPSYVVREQYLDDLWEMVNPIAFAIAACRLHLENEQHPKGRIESKINLIYRLLQRHNRQRINFEAVLVLFPFINAVITLDTAWQKVFEAELKNHISLSASLSKGQRSALLEKMSEVF